MERIPNFAMRRTSPAAYHEQSGEIVALPWHRLAEMLKYKCAEAGIAFEQATESAAARGRGVTEQIRAQEKRNLANLRDLSRDIKEIAEEAKL